MKDIPKTTPAGAGTGTSDGDSGNLNSAAQSGKHDDLYRILYSELDEARR